MMRSLVLPVLSCLLAAAVFMSKASSVSAECCENDVENESLFCQMYLQKSPEEQAEIRLAFGENCKGKDEDKMMQKRKPNFIRFGRTADPRPNFVRFGRAADMNPSFLRFGRPELPNFLRFGRDLTEGFERYDRKPNFIRFGRADPLSGPNFIRFGRAGSSMNPNFIRFGRSDSNFQRPYRKPNFVRFGRSA